MQLFIIDRNPFVAASYLADCHVRKQILETAQILTAYWVNSGFDLLRWMPKPQNYNHPVCKAINPNNVSWVLDHFEGLLIEFDLRFQKYHKYESLKFRFRNEMLTNDLVNLFYVDVETLPRMFSGFIPKPGDIVSQYREYYQWKSTQIENFKYIWQNPPEWLHIEDNSKPLTMDQETYNIFKGICEDCQVMYYGEKDCTFCMIKRMLDNVDRHNKSTMRSRHNERK